MPLAAGNMTLVVIEAVGAGAAGGVTTAGGDGGWLGINIAV